MNYPTRFPAKIPSCSTAGFALVGAWLFLGSACAWKESRKEVVHFYRGGSVQTARIDLVKDLKSRGFYEDRRDLWKMDFSSIRIVSVKERPSPERGVDIQLSSENYDLRTIAHPPSGGP